MMFIHIKEYISDYGFSNYLVNLVFYWSTHINLFHNFCKKNLKKGEQLKQKTFEVSFTEIS